MCKDACDSPDSSDSSSHGLQKPFPSSSVHSRSLSSSHNPSEPHPDFCYRRPELHHRPFTFTPVPSDCSSPQTAVDRVQSSAGKPSGGTWPKVIAVASITECAQLSIYKKVKQRKSIFDVQGFRRPEPSPKLDYTSLSQIPKHSPQSSISEAPPTPPARSDSFRFKHRQQNSSASDSTITTATPPESPAQATSPQDGGEAGNQLYYTNAPPGETTSGAKKTPDNEGSRRRAEERQKRRYRPKSAPALRPRVTPLHIPLPMQVAKTLLLPVLILLLCVHVTDLSLLDCFLQMQSFSNDEHSPEPIDLLRFSPRRTNRYSMPFAPPSYGSVPSCKSPEQLQCFDLLLHLGNSSLHLSFVHAR